MAALTKAEFLHYVRIDEERLALGRRVAALERELETLKPKIFDFVRTAGNKGSLSKWGYNLLIKLVRCSVKWKDEFIKVASADAAEKIAAEQPNREQLVIQKAA